MIAFLKRRWVLLSCAVVLLASSTFDLQRVTRGKPQQPGVIQSFGLWQGRYYYDYRKVTYLPIKPHTNFRFHSPKLGETPKWDVGKSNVWLETPLWLPLSAVLGWLVIRELRWRETARAPALPSDAGGQSRRSRGIKDDNPAKATQATP